VVTSEPLDGDDLPFLQSDADKGARIVYRYLVPLGVSDPESRAAPGASCRLGMESPIAGVDILSLTGYAHGESGHGRAFPIVGNTANDGEPWTAVRAVEEGITVATLVCTVELAEALRTGGHIWCHEDAHVVSCLAWLDGKRGIMSEWLFLSANPLDTGERWGLGDQCPEEVFHTRGISLDIDHDACGAVPHTTI